ncbi:MULTISPECIES: hypothetical protein [unclassified Bacillus (in: firmicutes)]|nr:MULTISPECIES: hypothetical protein [unclassified Bacillus (in: firmicutes)]
MYVRKLEKGDSEPGRKTLLKLEKFYCVRDRELFPDIFLINFDTKCIKIK